MEFQTIAYEEQYIIDLPSTISFQLVCFFILFAFFKMLIKISWKVSLCLSLIGVISIPWIIHIFSLSSFRFSPGPATKAFFLIELGIASMCIIILIVKFFKCLPIESPDSSVNASERTRILRMVEENKITAEEGSELLEAMGRSSALMGEKKFSRVDIVMLVAVSMVILGFFLPWAHIRLPQVTGMFGLSGSAFQAGYHAGALGWAVFIIALLSVIPVFVTPKNYLYKISMLQIFLSIIGIVLVISILVRVGDRFGIGLIICLMGFIFGLFASRAKFKNLAA